MARSYKNQNLKIVQYIIEQETKDLDYCELLKEYHDEKRCLSGWF